MRAAASTGNIARVDELAEIFVKDVKKLQEVSKVARNLSASEPIAITAERVEENIQTLCPHVSCRLFFAGLLSQVFIARQNALYFS